MASRWAGNRRSEISGEGGCDCLLGLHLDFVVFLLLLFGPVSALLGHWPSLEAVRARFPGCCPGAECFDCGDGTCLSASQFHDGVPDCRDGSDEFCFPGQIVCGTFCADLIHLGDCLRNPNCSREQLADGETNHPTTVGLPPVPAPPLSPPPPQFCPFLKHDDLCGRPGAISCRGYAECILVKWLKDGKRDCMDGSDEEDTYANLFKIQLPNRTIGVPLLTTTLPMPSSFSSILHPPSVAFPPPPLLPPSSSSSPPMESPTSTHRWTANWPWNPAERGEESKGKSKMEEEGRGGESWKSSHTPLLDVFGAEFARFLSTSTAPPSSPAPDTTSAPRLMTLPAKSVEKEWIVYPNWPTTRMGEWPEEEGEWGESERMKTKIPAEPGQNSRPPWNTRPPPTAIKAKEEEKWRVPEEAHSTPKYPFDRAEFEEASEALGRVWVPIPFHRPWKPQKEEKTMKTPKMRTTTTTTKSKVTSTTPRKPVDVWTPEGRMVWAGKEEEEKEEEAGRRTTPEGRRIEQGRKETEGEERRKEQEGKEKGTTYKEEKEAGRTTITPEGRKIEAGSEKIEENTREGIYTTTEGIQGGTGGRMEGKWRVGEEEATGMTQPTEFGRTEIPAPPPANIPNLESGPISTPSSSSSLPPTITSSSSPSLPLTPPPSGWAHPVPPHAIDTFASEGELNCTQRMYRMASEMVQSPRCTCPAGEMPSSDGSCVLAPVSTFRARVGSLCGQKFVDSTSSLQEKLIILKLSASLPGHPPVCVRDIVDNDELIVLNIVCAAPCSIEDLSQGAKSRKHLPEMDVRVSELSDGACHQFNLNDCDEKAQCLPDGLRHRCRCLPGTNDTSPQGSGRRCKGTVIARTCAKFLGICVLVWLLMLLLLCFLLPILCVLCLKYCCQIEATHLRLRLRHIWLVLIDKLKRREAPVLPTITTTGPRRESVPAEGGAGRMPPVPESPSTLKVPPPVVGPGLLAITHQQKPLAQTDSEEYLIMEEGEEESKEPAEETDRKKRGEEVRREETEEEDERRTKRQQTVQSSKSVTTGPSSGGGKGGGGTMVAEEEEEEEAEEKGTKMTTEVEVHEEWKDEEGEEGEDEEEEGKMKKTEEKKEEGGREEEEERPKSAASRAGTPTIWDQYKILGDQFAKYGSAEFEKRKGSGGSSLDELIRKREGEEGQRRKEEEKKSVEEKVDEMMRSREEDETIKDDLDAELKMRRDEEEEEEIGMEGEMKKTKRDEWKDEMEEEDEDEPGRSIPSDSLPPGAVKIGFATGDLDIPRRHSRPAGPLLHAPILRPPLPHHPLPAPSPARLFVPRRPPYGTTERRMYEKRASPPPKDVIKKKDGMIRKGEFVVVRGRRVLEDEDERKKREGKEAADEERKRKLRELEEKRMRWRRGEEAKRRMMMRSTDEEEEKWRKKIPGRDEKMIRQRRRRDVEEEEGRKPPERYEKRLIRQRRMDEEDEGRKIGWDEKRLIRQRRRDEKDEGRKIGWDEKRLIRQRRRDEEDEGRKIGWDEKRSAIGRRRREAFVHEKAWKMSEETEDDKEDERIRRGRRREMELRRMRRMRSEEEEELEEEGKPVGRMKGPSVGPAFDPDLPSTSNALPYWESTLRTMQTKFAVPRRAEQYAEGRIERFRADGRSLRSIEEQIEQKVHMGCITGGRQPWDRSPRMDPDLPGTPLAREQSGGGQSDGGSLSRSLERLEERVHQGCITSRKPWDPSPFREEEKTAPMKRGQSAWELSTTGGKEVEDGEEGRRMRRERMKGRTVRIKEEPGGSGEWRRTRSARGRKNGEEEEEKDKKWLEYD